ncbi:MAG: toprim domain-containing protein, partial [Acidimicrobiales bacterium]
MLDRDRIIEATDLAALADELLGPRRGTSRSATWPCPSPQHAQTGRTPPVSVFRASGGEERWHCHGCGIGGSAIDLVMVTQGVAVGEALESLGARAGIREPLPTDRGYRRTSVPRPVAALRPAGDIAGLATFVDECADRLWKPEGRVVLQWLTETRGIPADVLRFNRIGADPGRHRQPRPAGMPSAGRAAVLPVHEGGRAVFAQLRAVSPAPGFPRYLNAATRLAVNPRVAVYEPVEAVGRCVVVTEGAIDALSANAAGFRAAAVLGAALVGDTANRAGPVVDRLAELDAPLFLAFDADEAGDRGGRTLQHHLRERGSRAVRVHVPPEANDLNGWLIQSR